MSLLHTLNSPALLASCREAIESGDSLLLLEDGVLCGLDAGHWQLPAGVAVYALQDDVQARGLDGRLDSAVTAVSMEEFVRLSCDARKVINWF